MRRINAKTPGEGAARVALCTPWTRRYDIIMVGYEGPVLDIPGAAARVSGYFDPRRTEN